MLRKVSKTLDSQVTRIKANIEFCMPLGIQKHFFTKRICCHWLCFHLPIEAACWYNEASEQLPQEWEFFHQVCTAEAPDYLCANHRSYPMTYPP